MNNTIFLIYARAANGTIGRDGQLPWHIPADLKRFKTLTMGEDGAGLPMIMGRKTFESLPSLLPGRRHIVLTRREGWDSDGAEIAHSADQALAMAAKGHENGDIAVIGGAAIYDLFRPRADRIEVTEVHADYAGDTFMKPLGPNWQTVAREDHAAQGDVPAFSFVTYRRVDKESTE